MHNSTTNQFTTFAAPPSSQFNAFGLAFGPDGNLYVSNFNDVIGRLAYGQVLRYDGKTGALLGTFVDTYGTGINLDRSSGLTFGPDGQLYVAGFNSSNVERFNGTTGAFIDTFVETGDGGLENSTFILFQPTFATPAPPSWLLCGMGALLVVAYRRLRRSKSRGAGVDLSVSGNA